MLFCVLNDPRFPCPRTHMLHVRKLAEGFVQRGYHYRELRRASELAYLSRYDVLYVSNHFSCDYLHWPFAKYLHTRLLHLLRWTQARLVLWNFHTVPDWESLKELPQPVVHLSENLYAEAVASERVLQQFRVDFSVLSLKYSSPMHPAYPTIGSQVRDLDFNFVGHGYQKELTEHCARNYRVLIRNTPPSISEPLRVNSFRRAEINLVFHSPGNINKGIVVERFAEAVSWGGIVFHDHPRIAAEFPGHPSLFLVRTPVDIDQAYAKVMTLSEAERNGLREASWESWKAAGLSYFDQAGRILAAFK